MEKIIVLEKRVEYEPGEIIAVFNPVTFSEEKLKAELKKENSCPSDAEISELFREQVVFMNFGSYVLNYMEVL